MDEVTIKIDPEFRDLIPPLAYDERTQLEKNLIEEGCRDALVLWKDTIVDGHNRYELCKKHGIPFKTIQKDFRDREDAIAWMIKNQIGRRNLPAYERTRLALRLKPAIAKKARENLSVYGGNQHESGPRPNLAKVQKINTAEEIAKIAGVSRNTVKKVVKLEKVAPPEMKQKLRTGEMSIDHAYNIIRRKEEEAKASQETHTEQQDTDHDESFEDSEKDSEIPEDIPDEPYQPEVDEDDDDDADSDWQEDVEDSNEPEKEDFKPIEPEVKTQPHVIHNSGNNEWYTPVEYIEAARQVMGTIDLDPASSDIAQETVRAGTYFTEQDDGLSKKWFGNVWMNPPYAADLVQRFSAKMADSKNAGDIQQAIVLVNNATETKWFYTLIEVASAVVFTQGRIRYNTPAGEKMGTPLQGQAFIYIGDKPQEFLQVFKAFGWRACL